MIAAVNGLTRSKTIESKSMIYKKIPHEIDRHVGQRIRMRRLLAGLSQTELGNALGVSFQQVQKYENGNNRIASSRLVAVARVLECPIAWFYAGAPGEPDAAADREGTDMITAMLVDPYGMRLAQIWPRLTTALRRNVTELALMLAERFVEPVAPPAIAAPLSNAAGTGVQDRRILR
jgi:transcriptional regulator with XRE-family HTH domain